MSSKLSRRDFIHFSAVGAAGAMLMPGILTAAPQGRAKKAGANDIINIGVIGLGRQAMSLLRSALRIPDVRVVAGADLYDIKRQRFEARVKAHYADVGQKVDVKTYENYADLLARTDIDGVIVATPDHFHAVIAIAACRAGKDVYLEKPMTYTIYEGQQLIKAVRENNRILQVGSQQRSSPEFLHVSTLLREGRLGKVLKAKVYVGDPAAPIPYDLPEQPVPSGLDWDKWHGPLSRKFHFNNDLNPLISLNPERGETVWGAWRWYQGMGGGYMTDWGAHMFDIVQWSLGKDRSGPVEIIPPGVSYYDHLTYKYDNGTLVTMEKFDGGKQGCKFYGEEGWIQVVRGEVLASDPSLLPGASGGSEGEYETNVPHMEAFIRSMRSRRDPNVPVEVGHSSCTVCTLGNIAYELGRPIQWNPIVEKFMGNDTEATSKLHYDYRPGYLL